MSTTTMPELVDCGQRLAAVKQARKEIVAEAKVLAAAAIAEGQSVAVVSATLGITRVTTYQWLAS